MADKPETKPTEKPKVLPENDKPLSDEKLDDVSGGMSGCACGGMAKDPVGQK